MPDARTPIANPIIIDIPVIAASLHGQLLPRRKNIPDIRNATDTVADAFSRFTVCLTEPQRQRLAETNPDDEQISMKDWFNAMAGLLEQANKPELSYRLRNGFEQRDAVIAAKATQAPYIVSADTELLARRNVDGCLILTPRTYCETIALGREPPWMDPPVIVGKTRTSRLADRITTVRSAPSLARC